MRFLFLCRSHVGAAVLAVKAYQAQKRLERWDVDHQGSPTTGGESSTPMADGGEGDAPAEGAGPASNTAQEGKNGDSEPSNPEAAAQAEEAYRDMLARHRMEVDTMPLVLEAMWAANVVDIQNTLKKVLLQCCFGPLFGGPLVTFSVDRA